MAKVVTDDSHYKNIADTLRARGVGLSEQTVKPAEMPSTIKQLAENNYTEGEYQGFAEGWQMGYDDGFAEGEQSGTAEGNQSEYDRFWDTYQQNGTRIGYTYAFAGAGWNDESFNPKYPITIEQMNSGNYLFVHSTITDTKVPISIRKGAIMTNAFASNTLRVIRKIIVDETVPFANNAFANATALITAIFEGVIGKGGLNLQWPTKLSEVSISSVVETLSSDTSGLSVTFSKTAVNTAFETSEGAANGSTSAEWATLVATKPNWTINLM